MYFFLPVVYTVRCTVLLVYSRCLVLFCFCWYCSLPICTFSISGMLSICSFCCFVLVSFGLGWVFFFSYWFVLFCVSWRVPLIYNDYFCRPTMWSRFPSDTKHISFRNAVVSLLSPPANHFPISLPHMFFFYPIAYQRSTPRPLTAVLWLHPPFP